MPRDPESRWEKPKMVDWYDPVQLAKTGMKTTLSTLLGSMVDTRRFAAIEGKDEDCVVDYSAKGDELWFDYMADTGDGWDSTYTMAHLLSSPKIRTASGEELPRANFVILGGDEVYPVASRMAYAQRLAWPFNEAARDLGQFGNEKHLRDIYCVPGNHDWYDSLAAFTRRFCCGRRIGCFQTRQIRSYFVLKLPHHWQIWAADIQLDHDIDLHQLKFFGEHARTLSAQDRIILCFAEPDWVYGQRSEEGLHDNIERFERMAEARGAKVRAELAGDIHNYQHYEGIRDPDPDEKRGKDQPRRYQAYEQTKFVSGGGGAFLHPTHSFSSEAQAGEPFRCTNRYPEARASRWLSFYNLFFAFKSWKMSALIGAVYLLLFWTVPQQVNWLTYPIDHPGSSFLMLILVGGLCAFSDLRGIIKRILWGALHGAGHVVLAWLTWLWAPRILPESWLVHSLIQTYLPRICVFILGGLLGGTLFGFYLLVSLNLLKIHENEAFSALRNPHCKHFLRFHLTADGLRIYVVGVRRTAPEERPHPVPTHLIEVITIR